MKQELNLRNIALATGGGAVLILVASQLMAKPNLPPMGRAKAAAPNSAGTNTRLASTLTAESPLVGTPGVRELFRPLISDQPAKKPAVTAPTTKAPTLPAAGSKPAVTPSTTPTTTPSTDSSSSTTTGSSPSDVHMLGVVEIGDTVKVLLKKSTTGESRYFAKGEDAFGFTVGDIKADKVALARAGKTELVEMSQDVPIESATGTTVAANRFGPGGFGGGGFNRGSFGGGSFGGGYSGFNRGSFGSGGDRNSSGRDRSDRSDRSERRSDRGSSGSSGSESGRSGGGFSTSEIMSLPTWTERLKKLEEVKAQLEPSQYDRLKKFMEGRVAAEKGK